ncbi:TM0106 family RecB-like putative nuclease [Cysteiniphilum sp. 6C5]|uniref:TM0106 family RecB-like putative nuclease n=1 Tax=unclassified Cysteiniphilum TaxID=2610889 RepID=UPI003F86D6EA
MHKSKQHIQYSPSDLTLYMESPFASWMDRFASEYPGQAPQKNSEDELMKSLAQKGYQQEENLATAFAAQGKTLRIIKGESDDKKHQDTLNAMHQGVDVIAQARLKDDQFAGYADFLVKVEHTLGDRPSVLGNWHYEVWDSKLANELKPSFVIQLCCYTQMLSSIQGILPAYITIALGNGENKCLRTADYYDYYQILKSAFIADQNKFDPKQMPDPADSKNWGSWSDYAERLLTEQDHLFLVATITRGQIKKLNQAGILTMQQLANTTIEHVSGMNPLTLKQLKAQASIQKRSQGKGTPLFDIITPAIGGKTGLALLPPHSPLDVFFDIEGYPLDEGGLEYLWGCAYFDENGKRQFIDFWAHDRIQEKQCFQDFIHWVYTRWQQDPKMHIYHYANYEIAACRKLMGRYGVCEYEVDQLLRNEVFVDLYKIVKGGILLGEPRYSIKNVEHLYRGKRQTEVGNGGDSVVVYEKWRNLNTLGEEGDTWQSSKILNDIRDYNIDDCNSTQELVDWLRKQQSAYGIEFLGKSEAT